MEKTETCLFDLVEKIRVTWEITKYCNEKCLHCSNNAKEIRDGDLSTERAHSVVDEMDSLGVGAIYFTGGEPLTRQDIFGIIKYAGEKKNISRLNLATNGSMVDEENSEKLSKLNLESVLVSLDGHTAEIHNKFRKVDTAFQGAMNGIELLTSKGVNVRIGTVIWKENIDHMEDIVKVGIDKGAYQVFFNWLVKTGRSTENPEIFVDPSRYTETANKLRELKQKYGDIIKIGYHRFNVLDETFPQCMGGIKLFHVTADGKVGPCSWAVKLDENMLTEKDLKSYSFKDLVNEVQIKQFRELVNKRDGEYGPGCPALCLAENNTYFSHDVLFKGVGKYVPKGKN